MSAPYSIVMTTTDDETAAQAMARHVVERGLAACVHVTPLRSVYRWRGNIEEAQEFRLEMKMRTRDYPQLEEAIRNLHSYETPEIIRIEIAEGYGTYLDWLEGSR